MTKTTILCSTLLLGGLLHLLLASPTRSAGECALTIELVEAGTGRSLPGLVRLSTPGGRLLTPQGLLSRGEGLGANLPIREWGVITGKTAVRVPQGPIVVRGLHGLETEIAAAKIDLTGKEAAAVRLPLPRFHDAAQRGYRSGNTHLHLNNLSRDVADRYLREIPRADALDLVFLSYLERAVDDEKYISNAYTAEDLRRLSEGGVLFANGEEHRHNFKAYDEGYGHVMFLDLPQLVLPVSIGPGISHRGTDGLTLQAGIDKARSQGATVIWCHNKFGLEDIPNWVAGRLDAQNIFDGGPHGSYGDTYYRYLNLGMKVPFSTGTDWFIYDFSRAYVRLDGPLTTESWLENLAAGRSYITNGPHLELRAGKATIGDTIQIVEPGRLETVGSARGRQDFKQLELIRNGQVIARAPARREKGHFVARLSKVLDVDGPCWLALRTPPPPSQRAEVSKETGRDEFGGALFAHTSPIYVDFGGRRVFKQEVAHSFIDEMEASVRTIEAKAVFADDAERERVLAVYRRAMDRLRTRLASK